MVVILSNPSSFLLFPLFLPVPTNIQKNSMACLLHGEEGPVDLKPFAIDRPSLTEEQQVSNVEEKGSTTSMTVEEPELVEA